MGTGSPQTRFSWRAHAAPRPETTILDIGTGTAVIPLILCHTTPGLSITAVEIQEELARIARHNVTANGKRDHIRVLHKDVRQMPRPLPGGMDMVIANPPYRKVTRGRLSPDPQKAMARHELTLTLEELIATASRMLKTGGTFITIYPVNRLPELTAALCRSPLCMETLRFIHPRKGEKAKLFMVRTVRDRHPDLSVAPPPLSAHRKEPVVPGDGANPAGQ